MCRTWETALDDEDTQFQCLLDLIGIDVRATGALGAGELGGVAKPAVRLPVGAVAHVVVLTGGEVLDSERIAYWTRRSGMFVFLCKVNTIQRIYRYGVTDRQR